MIGKNIEAVMNDQIKHELYSAYLYLSMSAHFESQGLHGFASWMKKQAGEEQVHAMKFFEFIHERDGQVTLQAIDQPPTQFGTPSDIFSEVLKHEQKVTGLINNIYKIALGENDYASQTFLHWFINEQVEEEANATQVLDTLKRIGDSGQGLLFLDQKLGER